MSLNLVSPGVKVREIDLTLGRIDAVNDQVGGIAAPFAKGPVGTPVLVETEQDLLQTFGKPSSNDGQYESWLTASSYLSYGGTLRVVRLDSSNLVNAHYPVSSPISLKINSQEDYIDNHQTDSNWIFAARDPGSWSNGLKVCTIDAAADYRVAIGTFGIQVGYAFTVGINTSYATSSGTVASFDGYLKGVITKVNVNSIDVKLVSRYDTSTETFTPIDPSQAGLTINTIPGGDASVLPYYQVFNSVGTATSLEKGRLPNAGTVGVGQTIISVPGGFDPTSIAVGDLIQTLNSAYASRVVSVGSTNIVVDSASPISFAATTFVVTYTRNAGDGTLQKGEGLRASSTNTVTDWYSQQTLGLTNSTVYWESIAPKPGTSSYAAERSSTNDEIHVVVVDDTGAITGTAGNILEKYTNLSKAVDARISPSENIYYKSYISNNSRYIYAGTTPSIQGAKFTTSAGYAQASGGSISWGQQASGINFGVVGSTGFTFASGYDYSSASGGYDVTLSDVLNGYEVFRNPSEISLNFLICGSSGGDTIFESQAKANRLIDIAEARKDCVATISPHRAGVIGVTNSDTQTSNIVTFFDSVSSSSYAVFDSGYKYMFDRFNNEFRYVPLNGDIAGLMARTSINNYPWFSPAGAQRGVINNAIKLAYNPSQAQRDILYPSRINPVVFSPGAGIILFGDKTGLSRASAFDRINVRRLFLTIEKTIETAARAQLFEFNDVITRTNFLNIIEPYLRDVKAKRGITDFLVVCDESNNTPDVIDANQFRADIFVKPARSINFIGLTFVANRTGVSFEEVVGTV
jgi:hypothetical protein